ncbi:hypothetical protein AVEN_275479-1 [Araneus ventricosus]|uniref:Uncharacterized protein n=1 Tax=Araneus ventricosus TaxID=182803 RepID=A0A4Y2GMF8_ARAVE|nr:hypothetical protein AVEN_275479-1 [Araneus ventricosus]
MGNNVFLHKIKHFPGLTVVRSLKTPKTCVIRELSDECSISKGSFQPILSLDLGLRPVFAIFMAKPLSADQEEEQFSAAFDVPEWAGNEGKLFENVFNRW